MAGILNSDIGMAVRGNNGIIMLSPKNEYQDMVISDDNLTILYNTYISILVQEREAMLKKGNDNG